uniref:Uncharacterized protein n=1 Tax=Alexandrium andersonii TaxID=327968 RepID=A0A7S2J0C0_9DINO
MVFGHLHPPAQRLPEATQDSLVLTIQELWARLVEPARQRHGRRAELLSRDTPAGMCFLLPVFILGLKRNVEHVFHVQYQRVFSDPDYGEELGDQLVDQINVQLMHLFDPDCAHASFGALDSTAEAIKAWRKLHVLQMKLGLTPATRMIGREFRTTPAVHLLVSGGGPGDPRTRMLLKKSGSESALLRGGKAAGPRPPVDERRKTVLYRTVRGRLASSGLEQLSSGPRAASAQD